MPGIALRPTQLRALAGALLCLGLLAYGNSESNVAAGNRDGVFHLGNGTEPQTIDPHVMSGSPEVRIARALFEGAGLQNVAVHPDLGGRDRVVVGTAPA